MITLADIHCIDKRIMTFSLDVRKSIVRLWKKRETILNIFDILSLFQNGLSETLQFTRNCGYEEKPRITFFTM